jgi:uncharacterized membrane protein YqjE
MRFESERYQGDGLRERPLGDLVGELVREAQGLAREELRLAKAELREEARKAARGGAQLGAGGAVLYAALLLLGVTLVLAGATFLPGWLAAAVVTALYAGAGWVLLARGKKELRTADPMRAVEQVKEDARWARETMRDVRSSANANA